MMRTVASENVMTKLYPTIEVPDLEVYPWFIRLNYRDDLA